MTRTANGDGGHCNTMSTRIPGYGGDHVPVAPATSVADPIFLGTLERWLDTRPEILVLIRCGRALSTLAPG